jgi:predicted nucleic acid-binding protein
MSIFPDYVIQTSDYEFAAECSNECRRNGIQGSHTDFLICAVAIKFGALFTIHRYNKLARINREFDQY